MPVGSTGTQIIVEYDQQKSASESKKAGKTAGDSYARAFEEALKVSQKAMKQVMGPGITSALGTKELSNALARGFHGLAKDAKFKAGAKEAAHAVADILSHAFQTEIDPKHLHKSIMRSLSEAEKELSRPRGVLQKIREKLFGSDREETATSRAIRRGFGAQAFQMAMSQFGRPGQIAGAIPANIQAWGLGKGLGLSALQAGLGVASATYGMLGKEETAGLRMAPLLGGRPGEALRMLGKGRGAKFLTAETAGIAEPLIRSGAAGALTPTLRAERGLGLGGAMSQLYGAMALRGTAMEGPGSQRRAQTELYRVIETGMSSGLQKGRWAELVHGLTQMMTERGPGMRIRSGAVLDVVRALGAGGGGFRGTESMEVVRGLERLVTGPQTDIGRAMAFKYAGGIGEHGDVFKAMRQMEKGIFGVGGTGPGGLQDLIGGYKKLYGLEGQKVGSEITGDRGAELRRGALVQQLSQGMGISQNAVEQMLAKLDEGSITEKNLKDIIEKGKPLEEQAYNAMIGFAKQKGIEVGIEKIFAHLTEMLYPVLTGIQELLGSIDRGVIGLTKFFHADVPKAAETLGTTRQMLTYRETLRGVEKTRPQELASVATAIGARDLGTPAQQDIADYYAKFRYMPTVGVTGATEIQKGLGKPLVSAVKEEDLNFVMRAILAELGKPRQVQPPTFKIEPGTEAFANAHVSEIGTGGVRP